MSVKLSEIIDLMEKIAPSHLAESWDNPGLAAGNPKDTVSTVLVALDVTEDVIDEAILKGADLILTHHPVLFKPLKSLRSDTPKGRIISNAIKNNIALFSAHTNLDVAKGGTNDVLAELIGLENVDILQVTHKEKLNKIAVYAPLSHAEKIKSAMFEKGAGFTGNYSHCAFYSEGTGSFKPLSGTNPYIGSLNKYELAPEVKIETICPESMTKNIISAILDSHPYEEPAYDIYTVNQGELKEGIGRIGFLPKETSFREFALSLKEKLGLSHIITVGNLENPIKKVSLCTGAGSDFIQTAAANGSHVYITGDLSYHMAQLAYDYNICLIDATHYATENLIVNYLAKCLKDKFDSLNIIESEIDGQPFKVI